MSARTRVLLVDDSAVVRRMLSDVLAEDPQIEVAAAVGNARLAIEKVKAGNIDVITLDVEMPDVTGLELLEQIRAIAPKLPVIMFSSLTHRAAATTLDALARGASDYVAKPSGANSREAAAEQVRGQLVPKIKALAGKARSSGSAMTRALAANPRAPQGGPVEVLAIGASTGGPNALSTVFSQLPKGFDTPIVLVQHMPPVFTALLAERLSKLGPVKVREAKEGDRVEPGVALVAPGDFHLEVVRADGVLRAKLHQGPPENSCRPAVDVLFRSVVEACGARAMMVVLTGMGQDGLRGCQALHALGGQVVVQDEASSVVWGMPGFVARAGIANAVVTLDEIAPEICKRLTRSPLAARSSAVEAVHVGP